MSRTATYSLIASYTATSTQSSISFSSIPGTFTDLVLVYNGAGTSGTATDIGLRLNSDTGTNYSNTLIYGTGSVAGSGRHTGLTFFRGWYVGGVGIQTTCIFNIMDYANTTTFKTVIGRSNISNAEVDAAVGLYRSTSAITSLSLTPQGTSFASGSTLRLYGIQAGNA